MSRSFVHLHLHTEHSMLDGLGSIHDYVARAKALGMPALAITDHGNLCGSPEFYSVCRKEGIEPVLGEEFYYVPNVEEARLASKTKKDAKADTDGKARYHVVILAKGYAGYRVLSELSTEAHRHFHYKPLIDRNILGRLSEQDRSRLVVLSGCAASALSQAVLHGTPEQARAELLWWREMFPHYYVELQHHGTAFDRKLNIGLVRLAKKYDVPWVITNDPHYVVPEDDCHHDALLAIQTASNIDDPERFRFDGTGYHLRTAREIKAAFKKYKDAVVLDGMRNTLRVAKQCRTRIPDWETRTWHIPKFPDVEDSFATLRKLTVQGLRERGLGENKIYRRRAAEELATIEQAGIADFLLITRDIIRWAVEQGIPVGAGRGSVCGTLVGYLVGIHKIDPVRYNLLFERFLNPARPRMPDIDTDFGKERRDEVFQYITAKYGKENVLHVAAFQRMKVKAAFQQLARAHGVTFSDSVRISKTLNEEDELADQLPAEITENYPSLAAQLQRLAGVKRTISQHPAGVLIADPSVNIRKLVPEMWLPSSKKWVAQFDLEASELMGLMKQDILGLRTLDTVAECVRLVQQRHGLQLDPDAWVPDEEAEDAAVYEMLASGDTDGVFQMEGGTNTRGIQEIGCESFEDIVSCTSLYRTGPIVAGFPAQFVANRKKGAEKVEYLDPRLRPILSPTWGVILYQEQVMEIARSLAGFSMEQVDDIKEAIKHKRGEFMQSLEPKFLKGCESNGVRRGAAKEVWNQIEGYSGYSYNRSHAVAYTFLTYQTARLKYLYPVEFYAALLRTVGDKDKRVRYLNACTRAGIRLLPPDINGSGVGATPSGKRSIRFGISDLAGIGVTTTTKILAAREAGPFRTIEQVEAAVKNVGYFRILCEGGALRSLGVKSKLRDMERLLNWNFKDRVLPYREKYKSKLPNGRAKTCRIVGELVKTDKGTTKYGGKYYTWRLRHTPGDEYVVRVWEDASDCWDIPVGSIVIVEGPWESRWENLSVSDSVFVRVLARPKPKKKPERSKNS